MMGETQQRVPTARSLEIPRRWPLVTQPSNRSAQLNKDSRLINCYAEKNLATGQFEVEKRFGMAVPQFNGSAPVGFGQGVFLQQTNNLTTLVWFIAGNNVYNVYPHLGTQYYSVSLATLLPALFGSGVCHFQIVPTAAGLQYVLFSAGQGMPGYYLNPFTGFVTQITDGAYPLLNAVPGFAFLDGTTYVMDQNSNIYASTNLGDPTVWTGGGTIQANSEPDLAVMLTKQLVYVVALKSTTTQFFYDAGNAAPNSPLAPVPGALLNYGCVSADTVQLIDNLLFWVTSNNTESPQVLKLENLQMEIVSIPSVERQLDASTPTTRWRSFSIKHAGHRFYGVTNITANVTWVWDIDQKLWYNWADYLGNYFPIMSMTIDNVGNHLWQSTSGALYWGGADYEYPNDYGNLAPVDIYTPNFDDGVDRIKQLSQMRFNADQTTGSKLCVRYSDDDYRTWTNFRQVDLGRIRPILSDEGSFYRRAYHLHHLANTAFRIRSIDLQMDIGVL